MSAKELNIRIDELTNHYISLINLARTSEEKRKIFETFYKTLLTFESIKIREVKH